MQNGIYNALFGAMAQEYKLDVIANNLANASTAGFKRQKIGFKDMMDKTMHDVLDMEISLREQSPMMKPSEVSQIRISEMRLDLSPGAIRQTGNPLDLAIQGQGLFKIETEQGVMYTRNGQFQISPDGTVVNAQGQAVLGQGGPIVLPPSGEVVIGSGGQISVNNEEVGVLDVVWVDEVQALEKFGKNLFRIKEDSGAVEQPAEDFGVAQGFVEDSNVSIVEEMVSMIETMRVFEAYQKVMTSVQDEDKKLIQEVGATR